MIPSYTGGYPQAETYLVGPRTVHHIRVKNIQTLHHGSTFGPLATGRS